MTWTRVDTPLHNRGVVAPDERLSWLRTTGIGTQHVVAMFGATFLVPVLTGFPRPQRCCSRVSAHCSSS